MIEPIMKTIIDKILHIELNGIASRDLLDEIIKVQKIIAERFHATDPERFERECPLLNRIQDVIIDKMFEKD